MSTTLRIMSSNIRNNPGDGPDDWNFRKDFWADVIREFDPDLLGLQEVGERQFDQVISYFPDYGHIGVAKDDGANRGEWNSILYKKTVFAEDSSGTFWLSETPDMPGSRSWDMKYNRICTWAKFRHKASGRVLLMANTHLDHELRDAQAHSARLLGERLPAYAEGNPIILAGDFNCTELDEPYAILAGGSAFFRDSYRQMHPQPAGGEATYHAFHGKPEGYRFDWILHTADLIPIDGSIVRTSNSQGRYPSDHFPITAKLQWP